MSRILQSAVARYVIGHWHGNLPLATTVIFSALGLRAGLASVQPLLANRSAIVLIVFCILANVVVLVWQVVGTLRAGSQYLRDRGDMIPVWATYFSVLAVTVVAVTQTIDAAAILTAKPPVEARAAPDTRAIVSADEQEITLSGDLDYGLNTAFGTALTEHPEIRTVILSSDGGLIFAARAIALKIEQRGLATHVAETCSSACTVSFMAGNVRTLGPDGRLGFHRYRIAAPYSVPTVNVGAEIDRDREYFASRGVSEEFLERAFRPSHDEIWFPTRRQLRDAGVITNE